jgi:2-(1,2-epoxy-1,2-dihydrophenyl)acetyl-CoA isomerase
MTDLVFGDVSVTVAPNYVATVTIHRPPDNYFDTALIAGLADAYATLDDDPGCRAIVLCAEGKHFCAGAALGRRPAGGAASAAGGVVPGNLYQEAVRLFSCKTPVVAAVQGAAIGGGLGLAMSADFRIGVAESRFSANFARLGFHHGFGLTVTLPAAIGQQRALEMLYTGARVNGEDAARIGLVDRLVPMAELADTAAAFAADIATSAPLAVTSIRATMRGDLAERIQQATDREGTEQDRLRTSADFAEGVKATAERRTPQFEGR